MGEIRWALGRPAGQCHTSGSDEMVSIRHPAQFLYLAALELAGFSVIGLCVYRVATHGPSAQWLILAALAAITGAFTLNIPGINLKVSLGDALVFTNIILFGTEAGTITAALDALTGSLRLPSVSRRLRATPFNMAGMALSAYVAGRVYYLLLGGGPIFQSPSIGLQQIILPLAALAFVDYLLNSSSVAVIAALQAKKPIYRVWNENLLWASAPYFASASVAALIAVNFQSITPAMLAVMVPILLATYLYYRTYVEKLDKEISHLRELDAVRERASEALRQSEEKYRAFFEEDLAGDYIATPEGRLLACNPAFARMFGFASVEEAMRLNLASAYPSRQALYAFLDQLKQRGRLEYHEEELRRQDGELLRVLENAVGHFNERGELVEIHGFLVDETERWKVEGQLRQAQKMEAVGRLAGGVAHDFNNLLTVILGYSELALAGLPQDDPNYPLIMEIRKSGERASMLTRQLLAFSRKQLLQPTVLDLNKLVKDLEQMLRRLIGENIEVVTALDPSLGRVKADPGQIELVLLNLAVNARDAMSTGGKLILETANVELDDSFARRNPGATPGDYVMLAVSDSGVGMDDITKAHLFEPFFTTKDPGKGTGLGLATVYGIVNQSNGHISVHSEPEKGTTFRIYLPRVEEEILLETVREKALATAPHGTETVLLVEDEDALRNMTRRFLESCGYTVLDTGNPREAIEIARNHPKPIPLLLTDVVMPWMSGSELAEALASLRPEMRALYMSGHSDEAIMHQGALKPGLAFLQKPFTREVLAHKVRQLLDAPLIR